MLCAVSWVLLFLSVLGPVFADSVTFRFLVPYHCRDTKVVGGRIYRGTMPDHLTARGTARAGMSWVLHIKWQDGH